MTIETSRSLLGLLSQQDSEDSWQLFVAIYRPFILKCLAARHVPASDVDDLCQETLAQVFQGLCRFQHNGRPGAFRNWLVTIISQRVWTYFQNAERRRAVTRAARHSASINFHSCQNELDQRWQREHDRHLVEKLLELVRCEFSATSWQAFRLVVLEGTTPTEAAEQLAISVNAVLIAKSRILGRLKQIGEGMIQFLESPATFGTD